MTKELTLSDLYEMMQYDNYESQTRNVNTALLMLRNRMELECKELNTVKPVAFVVDLEPNMRGFIDCMAYREGEFTTPLFKLPMKETAYVNQLLREIEMLKSKLKLDGCMT